MEYKETNNDFYLITQEMQELFHKRALKMTTDVQFNTSPSEISCRFCSFKDICKDNFYARP